MIGNLAYLIDRVAGGWGLVRWPASLARWLAGDEDESRWLCFVDGQKKKKNATLLDYFILLFFKSGISFSCV